MRSKKEAEGEPSSATGGVAEELNGKGRDGSQAGAGPFLFRTVLYSPSRTVTVSLFPLGIPGILQAQSV